MAKKAQAKSLRITLVKSTIGCLADQKATVASLGLKKLNSTTIQPDNPCTRGKIFKVKHLVKVEEA
ncbi:MAG: 50S ribosomal protein L30 [Clostridia bacterium]|nr:50S ribosomal protein L30 [Clostridia bacterium]